MAGHAACQFDPRFDLLPRDYARTLTRAEVYNELPSVAINKVNTPTNECRRRADALLEGYQLAGYKLAAKKSFNHHLVNALQHAVHKKGTVRVPLNKALTKKAERQVIDAAARAGVLDVFLSPPGSEKMTRLMPSSSFAADTPRDPFDIDPSHRSQPLVILRDRETKDELPVDWGHPTVKLTVNALEQINDANNEYTITVRTPDPYTGEPSRRQLRPIHYAVFTDDYKHNGRIYTGHFGHQNIPKAYRETIRFDGRPSIELDYSGLHPRLVYHEVGIDYLEDPYAVLDSDTKPWHRAMAKVALNALLNASSHRAALSACNQKLRLKDADGQWKTGESRQRAERLNQAVKKSGMQFGAIIEMLDRKHHRISDYFCSDAGMKLMNRDSGIALLIMSELTEEGIPVLSVHDSFIVPRKFRSELKRTMYSSYRDTVGFPPVIK